MGRFASGKTQIKSILGILGCFFLASCSSGSPTQVTNNQVPAVVTLNPSPNASLELGETLSFGAAAQDSRGNAITETFTFESTASNIVTVSSAGVACAGTWDSLTSPTVCNPGSTGTAKITAVANGVPSSPVTVYVHQHVTSVVIQKVPNQPTTLSTNCLSAGAPSGPESTLYEASAFNGSADITSSVGPFTWASVAPAGQTGAPSSVTLNSLATTAPLNQETARAASPGMTLVFASAGGVNSQPLPFTTCPVQSISLAVLNNPATSFTVTSGTTTTVNATVTDSAGMLLTGVPLTWNTSNPVSVGVSGTTSTVLGSTGSVTSPAVGSGAVTASCTPPGCNGGITPSMPIYPSGTSFGAEKINFTVVLASTGTTTSPTAYVTSTGCRNTTSACTTQVVPITRATVTTPFTAGTPVVLPFTPNSALFDRTGAAEYFGEDSTAFGTKGAMVLTGGSTAVSLRNIAGKILAVSPDGTRAVFSDTIDSPQQVFICSSCASGSTAPTSLLMPGATAAAFSPDNLKAYIVSGQPCPGTASSGCLAIISQIDAPQFVQLSVPASDVAFIGNGTLGYLAGGSGSGAAYLPTCIRPGSTGLPSGSAVSVTAQSLLQLADGQSVLALGGTNLSTITADLTPSVTGPAAVGLSGCPAPRGLLNISNAVSSTGNLGTGSFTPSQFFLSPDGTTAYILGAPSLPFVIQFSLSTGIPADISLAGNAIPLSASTSPDGTLLFVGANDGTVHVINTVSLADTQQVALPFPTNSMCIGPGSPTTQVETDLNITDAAQSGSNTTYSYNSLTGPALNVGENIIITGMANSGNDGTFAITALGSGTFTVVNANGVAASSQSGRGISGTICTPDLVAVKP